MENLPEVGSINPLLSIWTRPKATLHYLLENEPTKYVGGLMVLGGMARAVDRASRQNRGDKMSTEEVLFLAIVIGGLTGWIFYYIYAWALSAVGEQLNGRAKPAEFRTVLAWAAVPSVCSLLLLIPELLIFGDALFRSNIDESLSTWVNLFALLEAILAVWSLVILVKGTALVQEFSTGKAILNLLLPGLILVAVIAVVAMFFSVVS